MTILPAGQMNLTPLLPHLDGRRKHGHASVRSPTYVSWQRVIERCTNPNYHRYKYYGGRGISICERWREFKNFLYDMGERPSGKSIDRIDNDGNYEPGNCRWATKEQQAQNRKSTKLSEAQAREIVAARGTSTAKPIAARYGISVYRVYEIWWGEAWKQIPR